MNKKIIALLGFKGSGKDTVADYLNKYKGYEVLSFAKVLKDTVSILFDWDRELLEGKSEESREWRETIDEFWSKELNIEGFTPRYALQYLGTDVLRNYFHKDIWVINLKKKILTNESTQIVISDCRFRNEIKMLKTLDADFYEINRKDIPEWYSKAIFLNSLSDDLREDFLSSSYYEELRNKHISEWDWIGTDINGVINNTGTIKELHKNIERVIFTG